MQFQFKKRPTYKDKEVISGRFVRISLRQNYMRMFITAEGREEIREWKERCANDPKYRSTEMDLMHTLTEDFWTNGWTFVRPEQVGDLRDDSWLVFTRDYTEMYPDGEDPRDAESKRVCYDPIIVGKAYSYAQYALDSYIDPLVQNGYTDWQVHEYNTPQEVEYLIAFTRHELFEDRIAEHNALVAEGRAYYERIEQTNTARRSEWHGQQVLALA